MYHPNYQLSLGVPAVLFTGALLAGCSDNMDLFRPDDGSGSLRFELRATIDQTSDTRADESGFADCDRFGLFVVNYSGGNPGELTLKDNQVNNVAMTYNADANSWHPATDIYWKDPVTPADVYGYYPYSGALGSVDNYSFEVRADQSVQGSDGDMGAYEASDFLWAKTSKGEPGKRVELTFRHVMAGVKVVLQQGSGFEGDAWSKLEKTVTVDNTVRTSEIDLSDGSVTPVGSFDRNVVMNPEGDAWRAVVVPQTVDAGKTTIGITIDGKPYAYTRSEGMKYTPGKLHTFTITVDRKGDSGEYLLTLTDSDIVPWEADKTSHDFVDNAYITVFCPEPGKLRDALYEQRFDLSTLRNLKVTGFLTTEDFDLMREELPVLTAVNLRDVKLINIEHWDVDDNDDGIFDTKVIEDDVLPEYAFASKSSLRRIILPDGVKVIGSASLVGLALNSSVIIPESVTHLMDNSLADIGDGATIIMPHHLEYIGSMAFRNCQASINLFLANSIRYIGRRAFDRSSHIYGTLTVPNKIEYLGEGGLAVGSNVEGEIVIPSDLKEIPESAFSGVNIKGGTKVTLHDGITKIGNYAFAGISFAPGFTLPKNLKEIGEGAFEGCRFADGFSIPNTVRSIGAYAFANTNLKGVLTIPESMDIVSPISLTYTEEDYRCIGTFGNTELEHVVIGDNVEIIGTRAFFWNQYLKTLEIGKNVDRIGMEAFAECPGLQRIVCLAKEPPKLYNDVFRGFDPLHCHLEVPEESVDLYRHADGWKEFNFISPHRELSVGLNTQSCLNKGITRSAILYADGDWRVKSCPAWIHVSPDHAGYKEEITFKVDPLGSGAGNREGKVVFELVGKDYTAECEFIQYDYEHAEDTPVVLQYASGAGSPVNLFIVGDGFGAEEIVNGNYLRKMKETMEDFFAIEPYKTYRNHFNVSTSIAMSPDNIVATLQSSRIDRLNTFGTDLDVLTVKDYAIKSSEFITGSNIGKAMIVVVSNMDAFSGSAYPDEDGCALACISLSSDTYPYDRRGLVQHYAGGKAFAGLAPEYVTHNEHIKGCTCPLCNSMSEYTDMKAKGLFENVTMSGKMGDAPWSQFIFHPKYSGIVDMYEGGFKHLLGVWRSESQSVMGTYIAYYNTISRYTIYKAIMRRADKEASLEDFIANDKIELP